MSAIKAEFEAYKMIEMKNGTKRIKFQPKVALENVASCQEVVSLTYDSGIISRTLLFNDVTFGNMQIKSHILQFKSH